MCVNKKWFIRIFAVSLYFIACQLYAECNFTSQKNPIKNHKVLKLLNKNNIPTSSSIVPSMHRSFKKYNIRGTSDIRKLLQSTLVFQEGPAGAGDSPRCRTDGLGLVKLDGNDGRVLSYGFCITLGGDLSESMIAEEVIRKYGAPFYPVRNTGVEQKLIQYKNIDFNSRSVDVEIYTGAKRGDFPAMIYIQIYDFTYYVDKQNECENKLKKTWGEQKNKI